MKGLKRLTQKFIKANDAEMAALLMVPEVFPIGSEISYEHGDVLRFATVIGYSNNNNRLKVRGVCGTEYWLYSSRVAFEMERNT